MSRVSYKDLAFHPVSPLPRSGAFHWREELDRLAKWWREGAAGVCTLVGPLGTGKSRLAGHFLDVLGVDVRLPRPADAEGLGLAGVPTFVYSFQNTSGSERCLRELLRWVGGTPDSNTAVDYESLQAGLQTVSEHVLIVLDAVEKADDVKVTPQGQRDPGELLQLGRIRCARLEQLLADSVNGMYPNVSWLVTTRYRPDQLVAAGLDRTDGDDPADQQSAEYGRSLFYRPMFVDRLPLSACQAIFTGLRVAGTEGQLERLAERCGRHALMVTLCGAYIARFCAGEPGRANLDAFLPSVHAQEQVEGLVSDYYERLSDRYAKLLLRLRSELAVANPTALAVADRLSLVRLSCDARQFAAIFASGAASGRYLKDIQPAAVQEALDELASMYLVEPAADRHYSMHSAVRTGFIAAQPAAERLAAHSAIADALHAQCEPVIDKSLSHVLLHGEADSPAEEEQYRLSMHDAAMLEELLYQHRAAGRMDETLTDYGLLRAYCFSRNDYEAMTRLAEVVFGALSPVSCAVPAGIGSAEAISLLVGWGASLTSGGRFAEGEAGLRRALTMAQELPAGDVTSSVIVAHTELADAATAAGRLREAWELTNKKVEIARIAGHVQAAELAEGTEAKLRIMLGDFPAHILDDWHLLTAMYACAETVRRTGSPKRKVREDAKACIAATKARGDWTPDRGGYRGVPVWLDARLYFQANTGFYCLLEGVLGTPLMRSTVHPVAYGNVAKILVTEGDLERAEQLLRQARSISHGVRSPRCQFACDLLEVRIQIARARKAEALAAVRVSLGELIRRSATLGCALLCVESLLLRGRVALMEGKPRAALADLGAALFGTTADGGARREADPPHERIIREEGANLLAALHPDCGWALAEVEARPMLAEACMMLAAEQLGVCQFRPAQRGKLDDGARQLLDIAEAHLSAYRRLYEERVVRVGGKTAPRFRNGPDVERLYGMLQAGQLPAMPAAAPTGQSCAQLLDRYSSHLGPAEGKALRSYLWWYETWMQGASERLTPAEIESLDPARVRLDEIHDTIVEAAHRGEVKCAYQPDDPAVMQLVGSDSAFDAWLRALQRAQARLKCKDPELMRELFRRGLYRKGFRSDRGESKSLLKREEA